MILEKRNDLSVHIIKRFEYYVNRSKYEWFNEFVPLYNTTIPSHFLQKMIGDVYDAYQRRARDIYSKINFTKICYYKLETYTTNTLQHHQGDLKNISIKRTATDLSKVLTFLARHGTSSTHEYLTGHVNECTLYQTALDKINKYGFTRLMNLATARKQRLLTHCLQSGPIVFTSLTFHGRSRLSTPIISRSIKPGSKFSHFITISWLDVHGSTHPLHIPVKYNKAYHRNIKRYCNKTDTHYTVVNKHNAWYFVLYRKGNRYTPTDPITDSNTVGIDVNTKHNLITVSDGTIIPHNTKLATRCKQYLLSLDQKESIYHSIHHTLKGFKQSQKDARTYQRIKISILEYMRQCIARLCKQLHASGIKHISLEDIAAFKRSFKSMRCQGGFHIGRLSKYMQLPAIKHEFTHIAPHYGIAVSIVHSEYSSQECYCGYISPDNRTTQEQFRCMRCGIQCNADKHAADIIKFRLTSTVLRGKLLSPTNSGYNMFLPKSFPNWKIKDILEHCHDRIYPDSCK